MSEVPNIYGADWEPENYIDFDDSSPVRRVRMKDVIEPDLDWSEDDFCDFPCCGPKRPTVLNVDDLHDPVWAGDEE